MSTSEPPEVSGVPAMPQDGLLLHVGVFKTGTTTLQAALTNAQPELDRHGVLFRGPPAWGYESLPQLLDDRSKDGVWRNLTAEVRAHEGRTMVSAESLCATTDKQAAKVVKDLGRKRPVRVLLTVRALGALLPSTWQQFLKRGYTIEFDDWLEEVFRDETDYDVPFWRRNNFPAQVRRWGALVGEENVIVALADRDHPRRNRTVVEQILGVPKGTVKMPKRIRINRSMSQAEAELVRAVNAHVDGKVGYVQYRQTVRRGVFPAMDRIQPATARPIPVPTWALQRAAAAGEQQALELSGSKALLVGDMHRLADMDWRLADIGDEQLMIDITSAAAAVRGAVKGLRRLHA